MKKRIIIMVLFIGLFLMGCSIQKEGNSKIPTQKQEQENKQGNIITYENKQHKLKIEFPSTRTFKENNFGKIVIFFSPEQEGKLTKENIGITNKLLQSGTTLENFYEENKKTLKKIASDFTILKEQDNKIDIYPAKQIQYSFSQGEYKIQEEQTMFIKEKTLYIINYTATNETFNTYKKDVEKILNSIIIR